ncbi:MAG: hypothetical protein ABW123_03625 [Cystobacter sp.]
MPSPCASFRAPPPGCLLLWALLLSACGPTLESGQARASEEPLGQLESGLCANSSVSELKLGGISTYQTEMAGGGTWSILAPANGIHLEYFLDGVLQSVDERPGMAGDWYFSQKPVACGSRNFLVKAYPMVIDSAGNRTVCMTSGAQSLTKVVTEDCPSVCGDGVCSGKETRVNCPKDCCDTGFCRNGTCCPTNGRCSDGLMCPLR